MKTKNLIFSLICCLVGLILLVLSTLKTIDSFWSGFGGGLLAVGMIQIIRYIRYQKSDDYREKLDVDTGDERNLYLRSKACSYTLNAYVILAAIAVVVLKLMGQDLLMMAFAGSICILCLLLCFFFFYLSRKN